ncbi:hypothetical protein [Sphingobium sp. ZW T5_29]|uniref:hypothetical protein n=1 Tax=Sphingobium sp. ZW T5_29 TaxID=3378077 RepID=UPI00385304AA
MDRPAAAHEAVLYKVNGAGFGFDLDYALDGQLEGILPICERQSDLGLHGATLCGKVRYALRTPDGGLMKRCPKCAERIQIAAAVCRYCGAEQPRPSVRNTSPFLIIGGVVFFLVIFGSVTGKGGSKKPLDDAAEVKPADNGPDPFRVKAASIGRLKGELKDPDSIKVRNEVVPYGKAYLCGEVNSKNSFGGMTGFKGFIASPSKAVPVAIQGENMDDAEFQKSWNALCR